MPGANAGRTETPAPRRFDSSRRPAEWPLYPPISAHCGVLTRSRKGTNQRPQPCRPRERRRPRRPSPPPPRCLRVADFRVLTRRRRGAKNAKVRSGNPIRFKPQKGAKIHKNQPTPFCAFSRLFVAQPRMPFLRDALCNLLPPR